MIWSNLLREYYQYTKKHKHSPQRLSGISSNTLPTRPRHITGPAQRDPHSILEPLDPVWLQSLGLLGLKTQTGGIFGG